MPIALDSLAATARATFAVATSLAAGAPVTGPRARAGRCISLMDALWYLRRLSRMGPREIGGRVVDRSAGSGSGARELDAPVAAADPATGVHRRAARRDALAAVSDEAAANLLATADRLMAGHAEYFGVQRDDMVGPGLVVGPQDRPTGPADATPSTFPTATRTRSATSSSCGSPPATST